MTEPDVAGRLGASVALQPGMEGGAAAIAERMASAGLRHLRVVLTAGTDSAWIDAMLQSLCATLHVLPCLQAMPLSEAEAFLQLCGPRFSEMEFAAGQFDSNTLITLAGAARRTGKQIVIGESDSAALPEAQFTDRILAVGSAHCLPAPARVWITRAGAHTASHAIAAQCQALADALATPAERIYWHALSDDPLCHTGLFDRAGVQRLPLRLARGGARELGRIAALARPERRSTGIRPVLVTGGAGFIGANLTDRLAADGRHVHVFDALARPGVERNLRWLARRHPENISFELGDLRDEPALEKAAANASAVFHLAGQVAVTTSMSRPLEDFDVNARGTLALLDALRRHNAQAPLIFASTNKVYGDLGDIELLRDRDRYLPARADIRAYGISEARPLCFHTPYGCSKGTADQYVLDYAHSFGLRTAVLRMSCIYGERQFGTEDQGWVAHFLLRAIAGEPVTIYGDGRQVRDVLHVGDAVSAYLAAWRDIDTVSGRAYNLGGGPANAISLLQLIEHMEAMLGTRIDVTFSPWRPGDQRYFVADTQAIRRDLRLSPALGWRAGLRRLAEHFGATLQADAPVQEPAL